MKKVFILFTLLIILGCTKHDAYHHNDKTVVENAKISILDTDEISINIDSIIADGYKMIFSNSKFINDKIINTDILIITLDTYN